MTQFACWVILHDFFVVCLLFSKLTFLKKISATLSECQTVWIQFSSVQPDLSPNCLQRSTADDKLRVAFCISDTAPAIIEKLKSELQDGHSFSCWETNICGPGVQVCYTNKPVN